MAEWDALLIVVTASGAAVALLQLSGPQGNKGYMEGQAMEL